MHVITIEDRPNVTDLPAYRKTAVARLQRITEPTTVHTMEGPLVIDETQPEWDGGYFICWPEDGTDPYPIAPSFVAENYELVVDAQADELRGLVDKLEDGSNPT